MLLFACDLDQTLIFSQRSIEAQGMGLDGCRVVEYYQGKPLSYMTNEAYALLPEVACRLVFVPMTTRTQEAYRRVTLPLQGQPTWAITTNGARILHHGVSDPEWESRVDEGLAAQGASIPEVEQAFLDQCAGDWILRIRRAEDRFVYCIVERDRVPMDAIERFRGWLEQRDWSLSLQGRKLYFLPNVVQKHRALRRVCEQAGIDEVAAAGDSLLDLAAVQAARHGIAPRHGEIFRRLSAGDLTQDFALTQSSGARASEEILTRVLELADSEPPNG